MLMLMFSLFEYSKNKQIELSSDEGVNDEHHNYIITMPVSNISGQNETDKKEGLHNSRT